MSRFFAANTKGCWANWLSTRASLFASRSLTQLALDTFQVVKRHFGRSPPIHILKSVVRRSERPESLGIYAVTRNPSIDRSLQSLLRRLCDDRSCQTLVRLCRSVRSPWQLISLTFG